MCSYLGESYQAGSGNIGSAHAGRPGGCIPGCLVSTQQQRITSMVVAQAGVPIHLGVHSWAAQASMTWLFTQVIPGLDSLSGLSSTNTTASIGTQTPQPAVPTEQVEYVAIPPDGSTMVKTSLFPGKQVRCDDSVAQPIYLGNDTDSGISCIDQSTPEKPRVANANRWPVLQSRSPNSWLLRSNTGTSWLPCGRELHTVCMSSPYNMEHPGPVHGERTYLAGNQP